MRYVLKGNSEPVEIYKRYKYISYTRDTMSYQRDSKTSFTYNTNVEDTSYRISSACDKKMLTKLPKPRQPLNGGLA